MRTNLIKLHSSGYNILVNFAALLYKRKTWQK